MRLYLLPVSTRRILLYCQRLNILTTDKPTLVDRVTTRAAKLWAGWEKKERGWQKTVVSWGNQAFRRIPYEEWGLKSVPPLSARRKDTELKGKSKVELVFPGSLIPVHQAEGVLAKLGTEREALHRRKLIWCFIGMPITLPFVLVPVIPNIPFFYLAYRAWSHWRAIAGGKHVQFLVNNKLVALSPSSTLDQIYSADLNERLQILREVENAGKSDGANPDDSAKTEEQEGILINSDSPQQIAEALEFPEVAVELERARWQVEGALKAAAARATKSSAAAGQDESEKKSQ